MREKDLLDSIELTFEPSPLYRLTFKERLWLLSKAFSKHKPAANKLVYLDNKDDR